MKRKVVVFLLLVGLVFVGTSSAQLKKFNIGVSGQYLLSEAAVDFSLTYPSRGETATIYDWITKKSAPGFGISAGYFVMPELEIVASFSSFSFTQVGGTGLDLPSNYYYNANDYAEMFTDRAASQSYITLGLHYYVMNTNTFQVFLGAGGAYCTTSMELGEDFMVHETYYGYARTDMTLSDLTLVKVTLNKMGFYGDFGFNFFVSPSVAISVEGKYVSASGDVIHPTSAMFDGTDMVTVKMGGFRFGGGIKIFI
jgi:hypothetical protein